MNFASDLINWIKFVLSVKARQDICLPLLTYQIFLFIQIKMGNTELVQILPFLAAPWLVYKIGYICHYEKGN
jgi:hypothetical protein